jgi:fucokinase
VKQKLNENGGTVLNVAILLNGQKPVEVTLEKISEKKIVFDSRDMDVHVEIPEAAKQELSDRFVLIYTGQRRLARNLLRDVVGRYVGNEPESLFALEEIQKTAALMRFELERGNVDGFASLLDYHWELSKKVDAGSSNTLIEQIFSSIEELIDGKLVCGAGGGGFLQVILKKGVTRQQVEERLNEVFMDSLVGVADCRLVWE